MIGSVYSGCLVERKLGEGGMGEVFLATREADGRRVAVKFLPPAHAAQDVLRRRFVRTAEEIQSVNHPNVARVLSVHGEGPQPHMIMEWIKGEPLDERLKRKKRLSAVESVRIVRDVAQGLEAAHRAGLMHRDVKPGNVILTRGGKVKVIDFGIGKSTLANDNLSFAGQVLGTPNYMAPEQWGSHEVDSRCDIFSLGSTLYHMVTGKLPFQARRPLDLAALVAAGDFLAPRVVNEALSEDLEVVIYRMMEVERRFRYQTMEECAEDLQRLLEGRFPNVPRLEQITKANRRRYYLVPGKLFRIGRKSTCQLAFQERTVSREHAEIIRGDTGYVLKDLGSSSGSYVRDSRVAEVSLKDMDTIRLGQLSFVFRDGRPNLASSSVDDSRPEREEVQPVSEPVLQGLIEAASRRVVLTLIEQLEPGTYAARAKASHRLLNHVLGREVAKTVSDRMAADLEASRARLATRLFMITHEKLGDNPRAWLAWWDRAWTSYPGQVGPHPAPFSPQPRFRVLKGDERRTLDLSAGLDFLVGRDSDSDICLPHASVSRQHATVLRLHERIAIRDEASRLGTVINGERVQAGFLSKGDRVNLGRVKLVFEESLTGSRPPTLAGAFPIDPRAFDVLVELAHPSTARALLGFLRADSKLAWLEAEARWLCSDDTEARTWLVDEARRRFVKHVERAKKVLPKVLKTTGRKNVAGWKLAMKQRTEQLPAQVLPTGWNLPL